MVLRILAPCALLAACSLWSQHATLSSSVQLGPGDRTMVSVRCVPPAPLSVALHGEGGGAVTFVARTSQGQTLVTGTLADGDAASCHTSDRDLVLEFTATPDGGTVAYVARSSGGLSITMSPQR